MQYALLNNRNKSITIIKQVTGKINVSMVESLKKNLEKKSNVHHHRLVKGETIMKCWPVTYCQRNFKVLCIDSPSLSNSTEGWKTILTEDFPSFGALMMVLESPNS